ncbi:hypothetical protein OOK58_57890, partial [Streptomyces sp. NBC_01728]|nr:hypothetical protein [Streptomyces sp. NBC_01728]
PATMHHPHIPGRQMLEPAAYRHTGRARGDERPGHHPQPGSRPLPPATPEAAVAVEALVEVLITDSPEPATS